MGEAELTVLCVNAGSSTVKVALFAVGVEAGDEQEVWRWDEDGPGTGPIAALAAFRESGMPVPDVVGHRVVHGGTSFTGPTLVDDAVLDELRALIPLAPLHEPAAIAGIEAAQMELAGVPQVACFDTAFHRTLPEEAAHLPLPVHNTVRGGNAGEGLQPNGARPTAERVFAEWPRCRPPVRCWKQSGTPISSAVGVKPAAARGRKRPVPDKSPYSRSNRLGRGMEP